MFPSKRPLAWLGTIALIGCFPASNAIASDAVKYPQFFGESSFALAQATPPQAVPPLETLPPSQQPQHEVEPPSPLPNPEELLRPGQQQTPGAPTPVPGEVPETVLVERFEVIGSTVFSAEELAEVTVSYTQRPLTFNELFEVRSQITELYANAGYITSTALIPPQTLTDGRVVVQVIEGSLENVVVNGTTDLNPDYVSSRIEGSVGSPLNVNQLLEGLQLLQQNPLIRRVSAELAAGPRPGTSLLTLTIEEAKSGSVSLVLNNFRSPSVGSFQRIVELQEDNLSGNGDRLRLTVGNSRGSSSIQLGYRTFLNPQNGSLEITAGASVGEVVEGDLELLDIDSDLAFGEITWRQPLRVTPSVETAVGATLTWQRSKAVFLEDLLGDSVPFPSLGADDDGVTTTSAGRVFYEQNRRSDRAALAWRTQLSIGLGEFLDGTVLEAPSPSSLDGFNAPTPDNQFVALRGQAQWARSLASDSLLLLRGDLQLATDSLVPAEQFRLGGASGVRGYRQDFLLTDNGFLAIAEVRYPLYRSPTNQYQLQLTPFAEVGTGWNVETTSPEENVLASVGIGLLWQQPWLTARIDYGVPLVAIDDIGDSLQESGVYLSLVFRPTF